jgi:pyrimidine-nucleoside phosphorylase
VKTGDGAFMEREEDAFALARAMVEIGTEVGRNTVALVTDMNEPLGQAVGNALEVREAIEILRGERTGRLLTVCMALGSEMLLLGGACVSIEEGKEKLAQALDSGQGLEKLASMIKAQGGDPRVTEDTGILPQAARQVEVATDADGYIGSILTRRIGEAASVLGAGRMTKEDTIDPAVGLWMHVRLGDRVQKGMPIAAVYYNDETKMREAVEMLRSAVRIGDAPPAPKPLIYGRVSREGVTTY